MSEVVLVDLHGNIFYTGDDDLHEIANAVEEYLGGLEIQEIKKNYNFDLTEEIINCKNEALMSIGNYTLEQASGISMKEFDKIGVHHDSFTRRMSEFYYDISGSFMK